MQDDKFFRRDFSSETDLLNEVRKCLVDDQHILNVPAGLNFTYDPFMSTVYVSLFQEGTRNIRWGSRKKNLAATLERVVHKLRTHPQFKDFAINDPHTCRILLEIVTDEEACDLGKLTITRLNGNRLEPGIHGLKFIYSNQSYYYLPTDAVTNGLMTVKQVLTYLAKRTGVAKKTNKKSIRVRLMRELITDCKRIKSFACINYGKKALPLYRGYPVPVDISSEIIKECVTKSTDWILDNMKPNGQFLYYYDGIEDSEVDFNHPYMKNPTYYNILRHSGGTITLLRAYELTGDNKYLEGAKKSIDFFLTVFREHEYKGNYACYPFFNKKSKLGGAGIGLVSMIHYFRQSGDNSYRKYIDGLVYHILSRVSESGELIGYFIHPLFNEGKEIIDLDEEQKRALFSFYYPGEALLGLVLYLLHIPNIDTNLHRLILEKSRKALDFLIYERPQKYRNMFTPLPSDGWLMQAIEEWVKIEGFDDQAYSDFVYNDAQAMIDHMYQEHNSPYFDYIGSFYYQYGEHAYPDGARCEGLMAAYYLARHMGRDDQADYFIKYLVKAARNLLYTYNTPESTYAHKYPEKSINSFRFKLTRQWVRVDSVQHTACFYARLLPVLSETTIPKTGNEKDETPKNIDGFIPLKIIETGEFSKVYLVENSAENSTKYTLKYIHKIKYNFNQILREITSLKIMNNFPGAVKCLMANIHQGGVYFLLNLEECDNLHTCVRKTGKFTEKQLFSLLHDLLDEILFAKENNIFHLDISIFNVILANNRFSLINWGLSNSGPEVFTTTIEGNNTYLSPDIYCGKRTFASEIYSLGATLYFAATGKEIFDSSPQETKIEQKMFKHFYCHPDFPSDTPEKIRYLILRMLEKQPDKRATADEIKTIMKDDFAVPEYSITVNTENEKYELSDTFLLSKKMAEDGISHAQWIMGNSCEKGKSVPQSFALARYWYSRAADNNYLPAVCSLARLCIEGKETAQDYEKALKLLKQASSKGHGMSQYYLARMYENGWGVIKDRQKATYWYAESAKNSFDKAVNKIDSLGIDFHHELSEVIAFEYV